MRPLSILLSLLLGLASGGCAAGERCAPGQQRPCSLALEGGVAQGGNQSCGASGAWSACVSAGACTDTSGAPLPVYNRCTSSAVCGPASCSTCSSYSGVQNPGAYSLCVPFCQADGDCASATAGSTVTPHCLLGLCVLLCRSASSQCPGGTQCLPWLDPNTGNTYPGYDGLCE